MDTQKFAIKLIFNRDEIPEFGKIPEEAKLNIEVAIKLSNTMRHLQITFLKKFINEIEKTIKQNLPEYEIAILGEYPNNPVKANHFPYEAPLLLFKNSWKINLTEKLKYYEYPVPLCYAMQYDTNKNKMFYGIRKGTENIKFNKDELSKMLNLPKNKTNNSNLWIITEYYTANYDFKFNKIGKTLGVSNETLLQLVSNGKEMIDYYVAELANFIRLTEDKLDKFIKKYKKEHNLS